MVIQNVENQGFNLVLLSTDPKPRLKWTPELHQRFVDALVQLGGPEKAMPKSLMRVMGIPGLTLYHLKSHLQKYRLGNNQTVESCCDSKQEDRRVLDLLREETGEQTSNSINKSLQLQMEVQRELHEQIEVQKHLQLRIEAQGKYLQKVLKKAQETLAAMGAEHAKAELSQVASMVNFQCSSPSWSELTEARALSIETQNKIKGHGCSTESSLTSSETSDANKLLDQPSVSDLRDRVLSKKRKVSLVCEGDSGGKAANKKLCSTYKENNGSRSNEMEFYGTLDLNSQYDEEDQDLE